MYFVMLSEEYTPVQASRGYALHGHDTTFCKMVVANVIQLMTHFELTSDAVIPEWLRPLPTAPSEVRSELRVKGHILVTTIRQNGVSQRESLKGFDVEIE